MMNIYKIVNKINNKVYIGQTKRDINLRFSDHKSRINSKRKNDIACRIYQAMKEYGTENFYIELLEQVTTPKEADEREKYWISILKSTDENFGYNIDKGGHVISEKCRQARIQQMIGSKLNPTQLAAARANGMKLAKSVCLYDYETGELISEFPSIIEASRQTGCDRRSIQRTINEEQKVCRIKSMNNRKCVWAYKQ